MDNNKNRLKDRPKSNAELRKMYSEAGAEIAMQKVQKAKLKDRSNILMHSMKKHRLKRICAFIQSN